MSYGGAFAMNKMIEIVVLVEGQTEKIFVEELLCQYPYIVDKNICLRPIIFTKPGEKGGDIRFSRAERDIGNHLKQRTDTYVTLMMDYYGIKEWPGLTESKRQREYFKKAEIINIETEKEVQKLFPEQNRGHRFIPYVSMHETEALYFCDPAIVAEALDINQSKIESILSEYDGPEAINDSFETAPSKRLSKLSNDKYKKTTTGIAIAKKIGIKRMRERCPLFNAWIGKMESLKS
jgi:hypothetical protein